MFPLCYCIHRSKETKLMKQMGRKQHDERRNQNKSMYIWQSDL